ncbi:MAG: hypothetical protein HYX53_16555 [Chloroflexi bacterium]|nr:hypothetical protein [Chloroflexota bacterium]
MDIEYALIADYAEAVAGKLYLMGGGWDSYTAPELPAQLRLAVAVGVRFGWEETNQQAPVIITVQDDDGAEIVRLEGAMNVGRPAHLPPGSTQLAQLAANMPVTAQKHGGYRVVIVAGKDEAAVERRLPFRVLSGRPPA